MWRDQDRFPVSTVPSTDAESTEKSKTAETSGDVASGGVAVRERKAAKPFGLRFVDYSPGRPRFVRPEVRLCPDRQVGMVGDRPVSEVMPLAASMTSFESDGQDVLRTDWAKDEK